MDRRALQICIVCVVILAIANAAALFFLYRPSGSHATPEAETVADVASVQDAAGEVVAGTTDAQDAGAVSGGADSTAVSPVTPSASIKVPEGPFQVLNSASGRTNTLSQNDDYSLTLKDETGVSQWVMPFSGDLCGRVCNVDFYANGKIQFLFCSGSKLCLVDRLGRMVSGFPVVLAKEVLLGPDLYDFSGTKRYNIIVLNRDNTIDMYNLKGEKPQKWVTIVPRGQVAAMPEYIEAGSRSYWAVKTTDGRTAVYSFYGNHVRTFDSDVNLNELY